MRVHSIEAIAIDIPLTKNFGGSTYAVRKRSTVITRLRTEDGLMSEVYNGDNRDGGQEIVRLIREALGPLIKGFDIFEGERIWSKLFALTFASRDRKTLLEAIACVDCAVWDAVGKATGRSVRDLLGGFIEKVPIISIGGYYMEGRLLTSGARWRPIGEPGWRAKCNGSSSIWMTLIQHHARRVRQG